MGLKTERWTDCKVLACQEMVLEPRVYDRVFELRRKMPNRYAKMTAFEIAKLALTRENIPAVPRWRLHLADWINRFAR